MNKAVIAATIFICSALLAFQNCGTNFKVAQGEQASLSGSSFKKGEPFDYKLVPYQSQMMKSLLQEWNYPPKKAGIFGAVAISKDGLGYVSTYQGKNQDDENKIALNGCSVISGGQPCALLASGDKFAVDSGALDSQFTFKISIPSGVSATMHPFATASFADGIQNYANQQSPKALAVSIDGSYFFASKDNQDANYPMANSSEAARIAMQKCEIQSYIGLCLVLAIDNSIVFNPALVSRGSWLDWSKKTLQGPGAFPILTDSRSAYLIQYINQYLPKHTSIWMSGTGASTGSTNTDITVASTNAKNACVTTNASYESSYPCFEVSRDLSIVMNPSNLSSSKYPLTRCNALPRPSCAEHRGAGCTGSGPFYIFRSDGVPELQFCP